MIVAIASENERKLVEELGYNKQKIVVTGIGGINVIRALKDVPKDELVVNIGYAGSNHLPLGTKVVVGQSLLLHELFKYDEPAGKTVDFPQSKTFCYTSTDFVVKTAIKVVSDNLDLHAYEECIEE